MINEYIERRIKKITGSNEFKDNPCFYLYNLDDISDKLDLLNLRPKNISLYYAMKANSNKDILQHIKKHSNIQGVEIASIGELNKARNYFSPNEIIFTGPGKTQRELEESIKEGIRLINIESLVEAYRINSIAASKHLDPIDILVRINTNYHLDGSLTNMAGESTKMGIDEDIMRSTLNHINSLDSLNIKGFHVFTASGVLDYKNLIDYARYVFDLVQCFEKDNNQFIKIIDFGGGFGIDYSGNEKKFDTINYFNKISELISSYDFQNKEFILELGRYIVGESGYYVAEIIDIKNSKGKKHIVASGGVNHLRLPSASGINQPVDIIKMNNLPIYKNQTYVDNEVIDIGGPLCFSEDKIAKDVLIKSANIGDLVVVSKTGAYGYSVSSLDLLSHPRPPEYVIQKGDEN
jgi:diaminopimelate decarboxylase